MRHQNIRKSRTLSQALDTVDVISTSATTFAFMGTEHCIGMLGFMCNRLKMEKDSVMRYIYRCLFLIGCVKCDLRNRLHLNCTSFWIYPYFYAWIRGVSTVFLYSLYKIKSITNTTRNRAKKDIWNEIYSET